MSAAAAGPGDQGAAARALARQTQQRIEAIRRAGEAADEAHEATEQQPAQSDPQD